MLLTTSYPTAEYDSAGVFVARLAQALAAGGPVTVVAPGEGSERTGNVVVHRFRYAPRALEMLTLRPGGIPVMLRRRPILGAAIPLLIAGMFLACRRHARGAALIHANWAICGVVGGLVGRGLGIPVVTTLRGEDVNRAVDSALYRALLRAAARLSDRLVLVTPALRAQVESVVAAAAAKLSVIENGVGEDFWRVGEARRASGGPAAPVILALGSLIPRKGFHVLLDAFAAIAPSVDAGLLIVGDGPERAALEARARDLGLASRVHLQGRVPPESVPSLFATADLFVMPSFAEGRPNALLEAMVSGVPAIGADIPGIRALIEPGVSGQLFAAGDAVALAARLREALERPALRRAWADAARARLAAEGHTWEACASQYRALYATVIGAGQPG